MLAIRNLPLSLSASAVLAGLQAIVDAEVDYPTRVQTAKSLWNSKHSTVARAAAFRAVRATLAEMCIGPIRCAYCEDSLADEVEHILPKNLFPDQTFKWNNYVYACGPCNGPKSNRYGVLAGARVTEYVRTRGGPVTPPPEGVSGFINPRTEDPLFFFELDLGGATRHGEILEGTFELLPAVGLSEEAHARAQFTIEVLGLNREVIRVARANAFGGFRARLREYVEGKEAGEPAAILESRKSDLLATPHLTVFVEMQRQYEILPDIALLFSRAPEAREWVLIR